MHDAPRLTIAPSDKNAYANAGTVWPVHRQAQSPRGRQVGTIQLKSAICERRLLSSASWQGLPGKLVFPLL